ncbi:argonaute-like protein [Lentinus tigrinus ALCF2SS1-7]|uniref:argonaute-like protein n=1 Tax=Lentinus tigrinus ALCF2SS1-7 TaxID=1328758 RepID=UPI0011662AE0|nr:argonaute-like protein [Lentinus tigrinus ALCF2SS1-7]
MPPTPTEDRDPGARGVGRGLPRTGSSYANNRGRGAPWLRNRGRAGAPLGPDRNGANNAGFGPAAATPQLPLPPAWTRALPDTSAAVTTIGVKRTAFGQSGRALQVYTNHFKTSIPEGLIYHYDVIDGGNKTLPLRLNMEIVKRLQKVVAPEVFTPPAVYDGRKNMFAPRQLSLGPTDAQEFEFTLTDSQDSSADSSSQPTEEGGPRRRGPRVYSVKLTLVKTINTEVLRRFVAGKQSHDNDVLTAITALNVAVRMQPSLDFPFNARSFFTNRETKDIGGGIVLWRGYFQSVRPAIGRMLINVDITTGFMYKPGRLLDLALDYLGKTRADPNFLAPTRGLPERERLRLQRFLSGVRIQVYIPGRDLSGSAHRNPRPVYKLTPVGAKNLSFKNRDGITTNVMEYFQSVHNYTLRFPDVICVEFASGAQIPMECCFVPEGQFMRKQVPPEKIKDVLAFSAKNPQERLGSICDGLHTLAYNRSEYVQEFGMQVEERAGPLTVQARVLAAPTLKYGGQGGQTTVKPEMGEWNMVNKTFYQPVAIHRWVVVIYERQQRFRLEEARSMVESFIRQFQDVGIQVGELDPIVSYEDPSGDIPMHLQTIGRQCLDKNMRQGGPQLFIVVLPEMADDIYHAVKHFGDITRGVPTQCLKSTRCIRATRQYFANVCLKINVKMGGINVILDPRSVPTLTDPHNPTMVMGADVMHPAPGSDHGRPSFTSLVGSVDSDASRYVAECRPQTPRVEIIEDLQDMAECVLRLYKNYRTKVEEKRFDLKRILYYRDGVSEGEFVKILQEELPQLKAACATFGIEPKITVVVVGKRHHVRFFPKQPKEADPSGNCPPGTVVDTSITHPTEFDFYLQSHTPAGPTSRSAHYSILYDENEFTPDALQGLSFALCHVHARATRSVSIPAAIYYAGIVCARAKLHYLPGGYKDLDDSSSELTSAGADRKMREFLSEFKPVHENSRLMMYFS